VLASGVQSIPLRDGGAYFAIRYAAPRAGTQQRVLIKKVRRVVPGTTTARAIRPETVMSVITRAGSDPSVLTERCTAKRLNPPKVVPTSIALSSVEERRPLRQRSHSLPKRNTAAK
jgi:hypothetical protein